MTNDGILSVKEIHGNQAVMVYIAVMLCYEPEPTVATRAKRNRFVSIMIQIPLYIPVKATKITIILTSSPTGSSLWAIFAPHPQNPQLSSETISTPNDTHFNRANAREMIQIFY